MLFAAECWRLMCEHQIEFHIEENGEEVDEGLDSKENINVFVGKTGSWTDVAVVLDRDNPVDSYTKALELTIKEIKND